MVTSFLNSPKPNLKIPITYCCHIQNYDILLRSCKNDFFMIRIQLSFRNRILNSAMKSFDKLEVWVIYCTQPDWMHSMLTMQDMPLSSCFNELKDLFVSGPALIGKMCRELVRGFAQRVHCIGIQKAGPYPCQQFCKYWYEWKILL